VGDSAALAHIAPSREMKACLHASRKECRQPALPGRVESMTLSTQFPLIGRRIFVAGYCGMGGSALVRPLAQEKRRDLMVDRDAVDLRDRPAVGHWFDEHRPEAVMLATARASGRTTPIPPISWTSTSATLRDRDKCDRGVAARWCRQAAVSRFFLHRSTPGPVAYAESCLLIDPLEPINEWYAVAKNVSRKMC
jgi:GDP-L-fucose synthase